MGIDSTNRRFVDATCCVGVDGPKEMLREMSNDGGIGYYCTMKRNHDINVDDIYASMDMDKGLRAAALELTHDELAALLGDLANLARLPTSAVKRARVELPSFSTAKWSDFASQYDLPPLASSMGLHTFMTPKYRLPASLYETMLENAWRWQDVYRERKYQSREAGLMRLLEPYLVPLMALFQGRIYDMPEHSMCETPYSSGGDVEHEIFMIGGILFIVIEDELKTLTDNTLAQVFLELLSAAEINERVDFAGLRIYGLLTDLEDFRFYSYDPSTKQFYFDEYIMVSNKRIPAFHDMIEVVNKIFGLVLTAYVDGLSAIVKHSRDRANANDVGPSQYIEHNFSSKSSTPASFEGAASNEQPTRVSNGVHRSTDQWDGALRFARYCVQTFEEPVTNVEDIETRANSALEWLTKSVCCIPRTSHFTGERDNPSTPTELKTLAARIVKEERDLYLSQISQ